MSVSLTTDPANIVPMNSGPFFDGDRYWFFYGETTGATLKCKFGTSLDNLTATNTNGAGNVTDINNGGKAFSILFGRESNTWYAYGVANLTTIENGGVAYKWELTSSGLGTPTVLDLNISDNTNTSMVTATPAYGGGIEYTNLLSSRTIISGTRSNQQFPVSLASVTGMGGFSPSVTYPESNRTFALSDGYLALAINGGDFGDADYEDNGAGLEWTKTLITDAWSLEDDVTGTGPGSFADQNYSDDTSHTGGRITRQFDDGTIACVYLDDADTVAGNYGSVIVRTRGNTQASGWTTKYLDFADEFVRTLALTTDGHYLYIYTVAEDNGDFSNEVKLWRYSSSTSGRKYLGVVYTAESGRTVERIVAPYRIDTAISRVALLVQDSTDELFATSHDLDELVQNNRPLSQGRLGPIGKPLRGLM